MYFQKYDTEWEEWVDVDEDFVAETKDKLKVVTSTLVTDLGSEREAENLEISPIKDWDSNYHQRKFVKSSM